MMTPRLAGPGSAALLTAALLTAVPVTGCSTSTPPSATVEALPTPTASAPARTSATVTVTRAQLERFSALFLGAGQDYEPAATPKDLAGRSELVVRGSITAVRQGRAIDAGNGIDQYHQVVMEIHVDDVLHGELPEGAESAVYVELPAPGGRSAETYDRFAPKAATAVLYLITAPPEEAFETEGLPVTGGERGRPAGQPLWTPTTPQGFVLGDAADRVVTQPLEPLTYPGTALDRFVPASVGWPAEPSRA